MASEDFQVFVKPVGATCNLACRYCYYLEKQTLYPEEVPWLMRPEILEEYIVQHIQASSGHDIFFSWHGGEPLIAGLPYFQRIIELQQKHQPENCRIVNGIQTNGTLLDEKWCRFLKRENFLVGISLDGPEQFHSENRLRKDRKSSFEEVMKGIQFLKSYQISYEILCVVHSQNVQYPMEVYRFFKNLNVEFLTFIPLVERLSADHNKVSEHTVPSKAFGEFLCTIFDEWKEKDIGKIKIQIIEEVLRTAFNLDHTLCIFRKTCGRVPVVERNGDFYSCDHFVDSAHRVGNIGQTSLSKLLESPEQKAFGQAKLITLPEYCLNCDFLSMCNGACPKDRFINTPDGEPGLNYLCEGYKLFFNQCKPFVEEVAEVWNNKPLSNLSL